VTLPDAQVDDLFERTMKNEGYELKVDLQSHTVTDSHGLNLTFEVDPFRRECLLNGWDDIGLTLRHQNLIDAFEKAHSQRVVMYEPVDAIVTKV
jgi:3-isopropylmalate/(R)-2-methylmalate dehydratase small subunit